MIKLLGGCLVFAGCLGLGLWYRHQFSARIKALRSLEHMLELLASEVRYGRATLPECCSHIAGGLDLDFEEAFREVGRRMEENMGTSFGEVFREEMEKALGGLPLQEADRENFLRFAARTGFSDSQMQLREIEQSAELLRNTRERLERENTEKCRMAVGLGAMGGLLLILVLW